MNGKSLRSSLYLHMSPLLVLVFMHGCGGKGKAHQGNNGSPDEKIQEKTKKKRQPMEVTLVYGPPRPKQKPLNKVKDKDCPYGFYGGIGVSWNLFDGPSIKKVDKGYVGYEIGLEEGDMITSPEESQVRGEVGSELNLTVKKKNGEIKTYFIVRDKICLQKKE